MARKIAVIALLAYITMICIVHVSSAGGFDLGEYINGKIQDTIKKEGITCSNYEEFCQKSNQQFQTDGNKIGDANEMAIEFCKVILKLHVCLEENRIP